MESEGQWLRVPAGKCITLGRALFLLQEYPHPCLELLSGKNPRGVEDLEAEHSVLGVLAPFLRYKLEVGCSDDADVSVFP